LGGQYANHLSRASFRCVLFRRLPLVPNPGTARALPEVTVRESEERWKQLCQEAANEQDPRKLLELTRQINDLLLLKREPRHREDTQRP
jgi:hypothetical protein